MPENLYKRNGVWYTRFKVGGRDIRRSLRAGSVREARQERDRIRKRLNSSRLEGVELHSWPQAYLEWKASAPAKPSTFKRYKVSLKQLDPLLRDLNVEEITTKTIAEVVKTRRAAKVTNATIRRDLTAISSVLRYCCAQGWRDDNPAKAYDRGIIKEQRDPIVLPEQEQIDGVVGIAPGNFARMIRFAQYTGMRQEEIASLRHSQVRDGVVDLMKTKRNRARAVPLDSRAGGTLEGTERHENGPWVFWHGTTGGRYKNVSSRFAQLAAKWASKVKGRKAFRFHDLRHWFAVDYLRRGGNIYVLQQILGHTSIKTTEGYLDYLTPEEQRIAKHGVVAQTGHSDNGLRDDATPQKSVDTDE